MNGSTETPVRFPVNATEPPEIFRFVPGSTPFSWNLTTARSREGRNGTGTGNYIDDEPLPDLNDFQTLVLACIATLILLIIIVFAVFGLRVLWKRLKRRECADYDGVLQTNDSSEVLSRPLHSHLFNSDKMKGADTHISIGTEGVEVCDETTVNSSSVRGNHSSTNGSIITMTLKNNHLIVETEERNDLEEDSRETTMKYSPSARDGVFVVEVQQGVRRSPSSAVKTEDRASVTVSSVSDQCALVHNPPDRFSDEDTLEESDEKYYVETTSPNRGTPDSLIARIKTGLSQSDLSLSSNTASYCYGSQQGYDSGCYGYPVYGGYVNDDPPKPPPNQPNPTKPKITSAVFKRTASKQASIDPLQDGPLNSDRRLNEQQTARIAEEDDKIQQEQIRLGNAPGLSQLKNLMSTDGKFEKLTNDVSPADGVSNQGFDDK